MMMGCNVAQMGLGRKGLGGEKAQAPPATTPRNSASVTAKRRSMERRGQDGDDARPPRQRIERLRLRFKGRRELDGHS